jgi:hypothetical protein
VRNLPEVKEKRRIKPGVLESFSAESQRQSRRATIGSAFWQALQRGLAPTPSGADRMSANPRGGVFRLRRKVAWRLLSQAIANDLRLRNSEFRIPNYDLKNS